MSSNIAARKNTNIYTKYLNNINIDHMISIHHSLKKKAHEKIWYLIVQVEIENRHEVFAFLVCCFGHVARSDGNANMHFYLLLFNRFLSFKCHII
jgi:hypothetical protein